MLQRAKERNILQAIKRRKDNWMGFILHRNCLYVIEGRVEVMGRRSRRSSGSGGGRRRRILRKIKATVN
jgi:hypothetical protein